MKAVSETEKETLLRKKEEINVEFEAYKFADVRDNERFFVLLICAKTSLTNNETFWILSRRNDELMQTLKDEIEKQTEKNERIRLENEKMRSRIVSIMQRVHGFCLTMKVFAILSWMANL